jgi:hypothetical protein
MTLAEATERVRRLSRTSSSGASDTVIMQRINDAMSEFAKSVHGLAKEDYISVTPRFDIQTDMAIRVTIVGGYNVHAAVDVPLCTVDATDQTGTQVATALQATLRTAINSGGGGPTLATVVWSTTEWKFTVSGINSTSITIEPPTGIIYSDATGLLGLAGTGTITFVGEIPKDCTCEATLPTDFLQIIGNPEWDGNPLYPAPYDLFISPNAIGTPQMWSIRGDRIRFYPGPDSQGICRIAYKYVPTAFGNVQGYQECGVANKTVVTATGLSATTQYYWKVSVDGAVTVEYSITTASDLTYAALIALLNAALSTVTWSIVSGDLRCTSNTQGANSSINLAAGTTGTSLFATLTGYTVLDATVPPDSVEDLPIDDRWNQAVIYKAAHDIAEENFEMQIADRYFQQFKRICGEFVAHHNNSTTSIFPRSDPGPAVRVLYD